MNIKPKKTRTEVGVEIGRVAAGFPVDYFYRSKWRVGQKFSTAVGRVSVNAFLMKFMFVRISI